MPLAMLPTKCLQHCQDQMIQANIARQKSAALSRADDSGQCVTKKSINFPYMNYLVTQKHQHCELGIFMIGNFV